MTSELIKDIVVVLIAALSGLIGVIIGGRMNWQLEAKKLRFEKANDKVHKMYIPLVESIEAFIDDFCDETNKDMQYFDANRLCYYEGDTWDTLEHLVKDAQSGSKRSLLNKEHRDLIDDLYKDIERFIEIPKRCFIECFQFWDCSDLPGKPPLDINKEDIISSVKAGEVLDNAKNPFDKAMDGIINRYIIELRKLDKSIMDEKLPLLKRKLIAFIDATENVIE